MRFYFHLVGPDDILHDEVGIETSSLETAKSEALLAVQEILAELEDASDSWHGWQLEVTDASQKALFTIDLERRPPLEYMTEHVSAIRSGRHALHCILLTLACGIVWDNLASIG